ncbi:uncharacterized protein LOC115290080 isoform X3 [Suricata suricatta]|uniref:uncharacterized protein LOC115290080 isoform X3 n=1 Tax=Suricata suricatta TaxID=37032 RepID=UPI00115579D1|nr:uncharacterized protein LOC115290080 isoform X3 [Suricata suricatta]
MTVSVRACHALGSCWSCDSVPCTFDKVRSPQTGEVSDLNQQVWILQDQIIVTVPRTDSVTPVTVTVVPCKYPESLEQGRGIPIYMGIENPEMCLSCEDIGGQPTLQLKPLLFLLGVLCHVSGGGDTGSVQQSLTRGALPLLPLQGWQDLHLRVRGLPWLVHRLLGDPSPPLPHFRPGGKEQC